MKLRHALCTLLLVAACGGDSEDEGGLTLSWTDNADNEDGFAVERKTGVAGTFAEITRVGANVETYADGSAPTGEEVCYRVRAFNAAGSSAYTNEACGTAAAGRRTTLRISPSGAPERTTK